MRATTIKLLVFATVMVLIFAGLVVVFSQYRSGDTKGYHAVFSDASGLKKGDKVRISGVVVGSVTGVSINGVDQAAVNFNADAKYPLLQSTHADVRYENLTGDRYLELTQAPGSAKELGAGGTIPASQTAPALDLDVLLGGFKPLFSALDPDQVNRLAASLLQVLQGQGNTLVSLLSGTSEFTKTLADRDQLIGEVINNLNTVLGTVDKHNDQFSDIINNLQQVISQLAASRDPVANSLTDIDHATGTLASLLTDTRPNIKDDVNQLNRTMSVLNADSSQKELNWVLENMPAAYRQLVRVGSYGSFFNFYVCKMAFQFDGLGGKPMTLVMHEQKTGRCAP
ncbi:MCE family protein [Rhodococcus sp. D2-41]|uniref:MCE family protein n=1 Tax=Speluncibacter jeojiensis TaxID=2710754 RepID=A0A9X4LZK4_9ACTN|nr:MCE family protein [Rhodococcus sp. D2-41]MDG3011515.1 MCE family protein [Rhodococcus sp. D2-41]MDG3015129.1 MCE family protein [Corynebacteriales bacterium D3-21]